MPNHFHFMIQATEASCKEISSYGDKSMQILARKIGLLLSSYSQYVNHQNKTSGSLFQQKTKAKCISLLDTSIVMSTNQSPLNTSSCIFNCMHYIHQNPMKAGIVNKMEDWPYSSFMDYAGIRNGSLCNKDLFWKITGYDDKRFYKDSYEIIDDSLLEDIS